MTPLQAPDGSAAMSSTGEDPPLRPIGRETEPGHPRRDALSLARDRARSQDDALTGRQALELGLTPKTVRHLVAHHGWSRPLRGVLLVSPVSDPLRARARAAVLAAGPESVVAALSAARLHGWEVPARWTAEEPVQLVLPRRLRRAQRRGARLRWEDLPPSDLADLAGIRVTSVRRTVVDLLAGADRADAVCAIESAVRRGQLRVRDLPEHDWLALVDEKAQSVLETLARLLFHDGGIDPDETQANRYGRLGEFIARVDFLWRRARLVVEVDGRTVHESPQALLRDRQRQNALINLGWRVLRFTWRDVVHYPDRVVSTIREALRSAL